MLFGRSRPGWRVDRECWLGAAVADAADVDGAAAEEAADPLFIVIVAFIVAVCCVHEVALGFLGPINLTEKIGGETKKSTTVR